LTEIKEDNSPLKSIIETFRKKSLAFKATILVIYTIIIVGIAGALISLLVFGIVDNLEGMMMLVLVLVFIMIFGTGFIAFLFIEMMGGIVQIRRKDRKRIKQIREAGLDQLEDGEQAMSSEELEERYYQRQAIAQNNVRRRPVIAILNERPSNETILKKMTFKGKITGEKCSICKLDLRKKQTVVRCPKCYALFHYDHLNNWLEKNNDCPVCDELIIE